MAHIDGKSWNDVNTQVGDVASEVMAGVLKGEELYNQLLELWAYAGSTDQLFADKLFEEENGGGVATPEQVSLAIDAKTAMGAIHTLHDAIFNQPVTQKDRATDLRKLIS